MHLDFATTLNLISTTTLIGALVFAGLQVRTANRPRRDQAAIAVIQCAQSETWTKSSDVIGIRLEAMGYMVFERLVNLETVDELMGGFALIFWLRAEPWAKRRRLENADPKAFEWCEWLAMRIVERRSKTKSQPAYLRENWRE